MNKCGQCKWLAGERHSIGIECLQPENQKKWNGLDKFNPFGTCVARYKYPSTRACLRFEEKDTEVEE